MKRIKKLSIIIFLLTTVFLFTVLVLVAYAEPSRQSGQSEQPASKKSATNYVPTPSVIAPDSVLLWQIKKAVERMQFTLSITPEEKAATGLKIARNRIAETQKLVSEKKYRYINKSKQDYDNIMGKVEAEITKIKKKNPEDELAAHLLVGKSVDKTGEKLRAFSDSSYAEGYSNKLDALKKNFESKKGALISKIIFSENKSEEEVESGEAEVLYNLEIKEMKTENELISVVEKKAGEIEEFIKETNCSEAEGNLSEIRYIITQAKFYSKTNSSLSRELSREALRKAVHPKFDRICRCTESENEIEPSEVSKIDMQTGTVLNQTEQASASGTASLMIAKQKCKVRGVGNKS